MHIRIATNQDHDAILETYLSAFPADENELVSKLAIELLSEESKPETFALVAEVNEKLVAHVAFSLVKIENNDDVQGYILAPLAVSSAYQKQGIGSALIERGMQLLAEKGVNILFVYGDPAYYGRFGFRADAAEPFVPAYPLQYSFGWQAIMLNSFDIKDKSVSIVCVDALNDPRLW